jgi:uncharacterized membrane protein (DUF106 family)
MNGIIFTRSADIIAGPYDDMILSALLSRLPVLLILIIAVIAAAVLLIRHFKGKKK